ncbi:MAG: glycine cleavage system protein H [Kiritimatiellaceae bacterium]|nr:glycine cleavage system protein H [Kiritimatiellaceae bacterium]RZO84804.1 MAG: glycine cleavage system protein GcvH [Kiritimatiellaceae bacterium]|tara:strand:+ start:2724 stop:3107 length:384 start_codon:yes stop_codon:yes gene_type:complete
MSVPQDFFYSKSHEWVSLSEGVVTVGITDFAQSQLSDLTFVELPAVGASFAAGDEAAVVESVKAAADVYAPVAGEVIEVNEVLEDAPETINADAFGAGWLFKLKVVDEAEVDGLMDADSYEEICPQQ